MAFNVAATVTLCSECWRYHWVLRIDVKGYFDSIDWDQMLKAVRCHTNCRWVRRTSRVPALGDSIGHYI
jgi:retron-type reverse transcriptase